MSFLKKIKKYDYLILIPLPFIYLFFWGVIDAYTDIHILKRKKRLLGIVEGFSAQKASSSISYFFIVNDKKYTCSEAIRKTSYVNNCLYNEKGRYEPKCVGDTLTIVYDSLKPERNYVEGLTANHCETGDCFFVKLLLFLGIDGD